MARRALSASDDYGGHFGQRDTAAFTQSFNNKNVGASKTLTPAGSVNDGNSGANYGVTFTSVATGVITARLISVAAVADSKAYDGTTNSAAVPSSQSDLGSGDTAAFTQSLTIRTSARASCSRLQVPLTMATAAPITMSPSALLAPALSPPGLSASRRRLIARRMMAPPPLRQFRPSRPAASRAVILPISARLSITRMLGTAIADARRLSQRCNGGANYTVSFATVSTGTITARSITVSAATDSKVYDATISSVGRARDHQRQPRQRDTANFSQTFNNKNVGTSKLLTPAGSVNDGMVAPITASPSTL